MTVNNQLVLVVGKSASGKSASLRNLKDHDGVVYLGCESGKHLPFKNDFRKLTITDPKHIYTAFTQAEDHDKIHTIVIDSMTFLMDMYETTKVIPSSDGRKAWGAYAQYWKKLMQQYVALSTKHIIMTAHTMDVLNESEGVVETLVKVKGSLMNQGIEAYFCNVVACKKMPVAKLAAYENDHLIITEEEEMLGFKYVYQTKLTKETINERIRGPLGMWDTKETFIDNDAQFLIDQLTAYYAPPSTK
jgi:hypothetical protein